MNQCEKKIFLSMLIGIIFTIISFIFLSKILLSIFPSINQSLLEISVGMFSAILASLLFLTASIFLCNCEKKLTKKPA